MTLLQFLFEVIEFGKYETNNVTNNVTMISFVFYCRFQHACYRFCIKEGEIFQEDVTTSSIIEFGKHKTDCMFLLCCLKNLFFFYTESSSILHLLEKSLFYTFYTFYRICSTETHDINLERKQNNLQKNKVQ